MEDQAHFVAGKYRCIAVRSDRPWGHGLQASVYDTRTSDLLNTIQFGCHPEFADFHQLQAMTTEQLIANAKAQLESGALDESLEMASASGLRLIVRFKAPPP